MDSRIIAGIRSVFNVSPSATKRTSERDSGKQQQEKGRDERQPTEEEARRALEALLAMENVTKNGLTATLASVDGRYVIRVCDQKGSALRTLQGAELLRLIEGDAPEGGTRLQRGRILDRKI